MNLALLLPAALAALAALLLPLLIHLARRSEQRPTDFAALRWLRQKPKPRHRIRFDEWPLLLLRLLLLLLLVLWLARPVLPGGAGDKRWVVALPGVDAAAVRAEQGGERTDPRWLAPGFPAIDAPAPAGGQPVASLLRELDADLPASTQLTVLVPRQFDGADAQRPILSRAVEWRIVEGDPPEAAKAVARNLPAMSVRHAPDRREALRYLRAAMTSLQPAAAASTNFSAGSLGQPLPSRAQVLVWLAPGDLPAPVRQWIADGGTALLDAQTRFERPAQMGTYWSDADGVALVEGGALGRGRVLRFTRPLRPASMPQLLEADFPQHLLRLLAEPPRPPSRVAAADYAPITGAAAFAPAPRDLQPAWALAIALLLLLERWLATHRRRSTAP